MTLCLVFCRISSARARPTVTTDQLKPHSPCQPHTADTLALCLSRRNLLHWSPPHLRPVDQVVHEPDPRSGSLWSRCHSWGENPYASTLAFLCTQRPCSLHAVSFTIVRMPAGAVANRSRSRRPAIPWSRSSSLSTPRWSTRPAKRPSRSQEDARSQRHGQKQEQQDPNACAAFFARVFYSLGRWYTVVSTQCCLCIVWKTLSKFRVTTSLDFAYPNCAT